MYRWLPVICGCHCRDDRSFHFRGERFPVCARCTGELAGVLAALLSYAFFRPGLGTAALLLAPAAVDGGLQRFTRYESGNLRRLVTGLLLGYGLACLFLLTTGMAFRFGVELGQQWKMK